MKKTYTVHEVLYTDNNRGEGAAGDGSHIARFKSLPAAVSFARGKTYQGRAATVYTDNDVPFRLASRWGVL